MLSFFRNFLKSKIGAGIALAVLVLITLAFAGGDINGMRNSAGLGSATAVATVGGKNVEATELTSAANSQLEQIRAQNPTATMKMLVAEGGLERILDEIISRTAIAVFGNDNGVIASKRLIDSEIARIPAFQGVDGKFSQTTFRQALAQKGIPEQALRDDFSQGLIAQQLMIPAQFSATMPLSLATRYASLLEENRKGQVVTVPSMAFAPTQAPSQAELEGFYKAHSNLFVRPERRVIRYAIFGEDTLKNVAAPTDADIAKRYEADKAALYAARDDRKITQLIVPTEAAAKAVAAEVAGGKSLEQAAKEKGLSAANLEFFSHDQLSAQFSPAVADAVFATPTGKLTAPQKSALGWHVIRVEQEQKTAERPLAAVRADIVTKLTAEKQRAAFTDLLSRIDDQFSSGASLVEVAKAIGATVGTTQPITATGAVYGKPGETAPAQLQPILSTAFSMEQEKPQLAQLTPGTTAPTTAGYVIYDVTDITPSAPAPFKEIVADVTEAWKLDKGSVDAKAAALKVQAAVRSGKSLNEAVAALGKTLPPVQDVAMSRPMLTEAMRQGRQVPPPVSLLFHMAKGTVKVQSAGGGRGWFVVALNDVQTPSQGNPVVVQGTQRELSSQLGSAYTDALAKAITKQVGSEKHAPAFKTVRDQLGGTTPAN
ncbi:peptidyl-prolyl cis-trans isomerase D [Novosphingobium sp. PhB165]|uniref:peptidylprolyl isomerase n=1 Tax=Novosphingobium sp. PhB165 TaxID=2485105 RepID=UPI00104FB3D6|nr:peptidylprolyl isomerase [Novosphingobium sp. PhB165]TCM22196.1 peptidyl-prolyl cis-trans isomerase D [Novosphingobium sp. PhB165]